MPAASTTTAAILITGRRARIGAARPVALKAQKNRRLLPRKAIGSQRENQDTKHRSTGPLESVRPFSVLTVDLSRV